MIVDMVLTKESSLDNGQDVGDKDGLDVGDHNGLDVDDQVERLLMTRMKRMLMTNLDKTDNTAQQSGAPAWHREGEGR